MNHVIAICDGMDRRYFADRSHGPRFCYSRDNARQFDGLDAADDFIAAFNQTDPYAGDVRLIIEEAR